MEKMVDNNLIQNVVIVGGGTAGWITAALMAKVLNKTVNITLIESDEIASVGVGEASIPPIMHLNNALGIDESAFLKATKGTFKLGIEFENWQYQGSKYMHAFGGMGKDFPFCDFYNFWLKSKQLGIHSEFGDYSLNYQCAKQHKFSKLKNIQGTNLKGIEYAYHFDAVLYANFLREFSVKHGVKRIEGIVKKVNLNPKNGFISSVHMESGETISADLFIDCSGQRALLIEEALHTGFDDWSHWLPCDSAIAVASEAMKSIPPYTRSIAHQAGWQWRIPLQHRMGNGIVYSNHYMSDEHAEDALLSSLDSKIISEPKKIQFRTGRRRKQWNKNVVAIGLSSGFFEPLESTNIHLIQTAAIRLLKLFPHLGITKHNIDEFNRQALMESEHIRDFIILHYKQNQRDESDFWRDCSLMDIPDSLTRKLELFENSGRVFREQDELFTEVAWQQVMIGQGLMPKDYHPLVNQIDAKQLTDLMQSLSTLIQRTAGKMSTHNDYLSLL
ncbi:MAG: tryptophan halogenase family protein [Paraglaciecola sp.]|uniref:tryptophan halogenase family protein n=1 Tax=Paraglaciecola sp. TaxID=1920173 RepID=UPI003297ACD8